MAEKEYVACRIRKRYLSSEDFVKVDPNQIRTKFLKVIETEGPVLDDLMQLRVLKSYGLAKRGCNIQPFLDSIMDTLDCRFTEQTDYLGTVHKVFWPDGLLPEDYGDYRPSCEERIDITDYPEKELENVVRAVVENEPSLKGEEIAREAMERLGYSRKGAAIDATLSGIIQKLNL